MEVALNKTAKEYSRYGSTTQSRSYIYGSLTPARSSFYATTAWRGESAAGC